MKGYVYILECSNESLYTGSTIDLEARLEAHFNGTGANHTKKFPPVKLLYLEEHQTIQEAFYREKQIQRWKRDKKLALIAGNTEALILFSKSNRPSKKELQIKSNFYGIIFGISYRGASRHRKSRSVIILHDPQPPRSPLPVPEGFMAYDDLFGHKSSRRHQSESATALPTAGA